MPDGKTIAAMSLPIPENLTQYAGRDLEGMCFAENYHRWILRIFEPFLGTQLVEVGAGTGSFSELVLKGRIESLSLVEPSEEMYKILHSRINRGHRSVKINTYNAFFTRVADHIRVNQRPDSIIYVNVMEHIADDETELRVAHQTLDDGGRIFIFVPALRWLYGSLDQQIGHHRRYTRGELESKCVLAGFQVIRSGYFDFAGIVPWGIKYRVLKSEKLEPKAVKLYDKFVVPAARAVESFIKPPIGKNLFVIAEKT